MLENATIRKILHLIEQKTMSQRQIAKRLGVSRGTVQAVAHGKRTEHTPAVKVATWVAPTGKPKRCRICGSYAKTPCLACQLYKLPQDSEME
jgi:predicted XRE-type DNA-binding protein